jgi:hypothetical protein
MGRVNIYIHPSPRRVRDSEGAALIGGNHRPEGVHAKDTPIVADDKPGILDGILDNVEHDPSNGQFSSGGGGGGGNEPPAKKKFGPGGRSAAQKAKAYRGMKKILKGQAEKKENTDKKPGILDGILKTADADESTVRRAMEAYVNNRASQKATREALRNAGVSEQVITGIDWDKERFPGPNGPKVKGW